MRKYFVIKKDNLFYSAKEEGKFTSVLKDALAATHSKCQRIVREYANTIYNGQLQIVQLTDEEALPFTRNEKHNGWGGVREGQGRKKRADTKHCTFRLRTDVLDILAQVDEPKAQYVEKALIAQFKRDGLY